jgi:hypothetical protein
MKRHNAPCAVDIEVEKSAQLTRSESVSKSHPIIALVYAPPTCCLTPQHHSRLSRTTVVDRLDRSARQCLDATERSFGLPYRGTTQSLPGCDFSSLMHVPHSDTRFASSRILVEARLYARSTHFHITISQDKILLVTLSSCATINIPRKISQELNRKAQSRRQGD